MSTVSPFKKTKKQDDDEEGQDGPPPIRIPALRTFVVTRKAPQGDEVVEAHTVQFQEQLLVFQVLKVVEDPQQPQFLTVCMINGWDTLREQTFEGTTKQ